MRHAWDGDGAWREDRPPPARLPPADDGDPCERLLAAAAAKPRGDDRGHGSGHRSALAGEVSRLERAFGAAFAARAVATCKDASLGRTALLRAAMAVTFTASTRACEPFERSIRGAQAVSRRAVTSHRSTP